MSARPKSFQLKPTSSDIRSLSVVAQWANGGSYSQGAVSTFLSAADFYLVAQALTSGLTVVTHERPEPQSTKKIKIPDACNGVGVRWTNPYPMLKTEHAKFVLQAGAQI